MDGDDQDRVSVQPGGVVIVKSRHGRLRERIKGGAIFDLNFFAHQQATFARKNKVMSSYLLVNFLLTRVDRGFIWCAWELVHFNLLHYPNTLRRLKLTTYLTYLQN